MRGKPEAIIMWFFRMLLVIPWREQAINVEVLKKIATKYIYTQYQVIAKFPAHITKKLENLITTGHIEVKIYKTRPRAF